MSTRAAIGRVDGDSFEGRYHHSDGYPTGLGQRFYERARDAEDLRAFLAYIVDEHRAGWSHLAYVDETESNMRLGDLPAEYGADACYCHTYGSEKDNSEPIRDCDLFIEWAYAINPDTRMMGVWASVYTGETVTVEGAYGSWDEPVYTGRLIAIVSIDDPAVDWAQIEQRGRCAKDAAREREAVAV